MESEDYSFFKNLDWLLENNVEDLGSELTFSTEIQEFGVTETRELTPNGKNVQVLVSLPGYEKTASTASAACRKWRSNQDLAENFGKVQQKK